MVVEIIIFKVIWGRKTMIQAKSQLVWEQKLANEGGNLLENLKVCYRVTQELIQESEEVLKKDGGIIKEHQFILNLIEKIERHSNYCVTEDEKMKVFRYGETAYMIWALKYYFNKEEIIKDKIKSWDNGEDFNGGSSFRNFEFECHTALRFLEGEHDVKCISEEKNPDFLINDNFGVECKRLYRFFGLFTNTLKARKQADELGKPTVVIMNLDYLYNELSDINEYITREWFLLICSRIAEYGLGTIESNLIGIVLEYVSEKSDNSESATVIGIRNKNACRNIGNEKLEELWSVVSMGVSGDGRLDVFDSSLEVEKRSSIIHSNNSIIKNDMKFFFNTVISKDIDEITKVPNFSKQFIMQHDTSI
jgi:hypothetical protein